MACHHCHRSTRRVCWSSIAYARIHVLADARRDAEPERTSEHLYEKPLCIVEREDVWVKQ